MTKNFYHILVLIACAIAMSCNPEPMEPTAFSTMAGRDLLVSCEGQFQNANGNISYINTETDTTDITCYSRYNSEPIGDVLQGLVQSNESIYMLCNLPGSIKILDKTDLRRRNTISIQGNPKNAVIVDNEMWINDAFGGVDIMDLMTNQVTRIDSTGPTTEIVQYQDKIIIAHAGSFLDPDNKIYIYDIATRTRIDEIEVATSPNSLTLIGDMLYVIGGGGFDVPIEVSTVNLSTFTAITKELPLTEIAGFSPKIRSYQDQLYLLAGALYKYDNDTDGLTKIFSNALTPYGVDIDQDNGDIFLCDAIDFSSQGTMYRLDQNGAEKASYKVGIVPNSVIKIN